MSGTALLEQVEHDTVKATRLATSGVDTELMTAVRDPWHGVVVTATLGLRRWRPITTAARDPWHGVVVTATMGF